MLDIILTFQSSGKQTLDVLDAILEPTHNFSGKKHAQATHENTCTEPPNHSISKRLLRRRNKPLDLSLQKIKKLLKYKYILYIFENLFLFVCFDCLFTQGKKTEKTYTFFFAIRLRLPLSFFICLHAYLPSFVNFVFLLLLLLLLLMSNKLSIKNNH